MINTLAVAKQVAARNFENLQRVQTGTFLSALDAQKNRFLLPYLFVLRPLACPSPWLFPPAPAMVRRLRPVGSPKLRSLSPKARPAGARRQWGGGVSFAANLQESCKGPQIQSCFMLLYLINMALEIVL